MKVMLRYFCHQDLQQPVQLDHQPDREEPEERLPSGAVEKQHALCRPQQGQRRILQGDDATIDWQSQAALDAPGKVWVQFT